MFVNVSITGDKELIARFKKMPAAVQAALLKKVTFYALKLESYVKRNKLQGQVLSRKSGRLARAIGNRVAYDKSSVFGFVFASSDVPYAGIQEYGGVTSAHLIMPKKARVLAFTKDGQKMFARRVMHPGSKMPERSYLRSSLREMSAEISLGLKEAVVQSVQDTKGGKG